MLKVLIIGPDFFSINESISNAFVSLGWNAVIESYDNPIHPFTGFNKWRHKFSFNREKLKEKSRKLFGAYIIDQFDLIKPDLVFIYNGNILESSTLDFFRTQSKVVLWMLDGIHHIPECKSHIDHVDVFFCFEQQDVDWFESIGKKAFFLPQAYDETVYYPMPLIKDIDILFVGNLYRYYKRIDFLNAVLKAFPGKKILIYGIYKPYYKNPIKWLFREKRDVFMNKNISREKVNELYNRAKLVLNIHHEQSQNGANPKVFEICGAGAYQICDMNPYIKSLYPNDEVGLYANKNELIALINDALVQDRSINASKAFETIANGHTFKHRVQEMLIKIGMDFEA